MQVFDIILSAEVLAGTIILAALLLSVRTILNYSREASTMAPKQQRIEINLQRLQEGMGEKRKSVMKLSALVEPLREREGRLRTYFEELKNIELEYERTANEDEQKEEAERRVRVQRKKMGMD